MTKPTLSIFTGGKGLGVVIREQSQIISKFFDANVPFTSTAGHVGLQIFGKTRIIVVQGAQDGAGFDGATPEQKVGDFIFETEAWVNSAIQGSKVYTDSFGTSYNVLCADFTWIRSNKDPGRVIYSFMFKEV